MGKSTSAANQGYDPPEEAGGSNPGPLIQEKDELKHAKWFVSETFVKNDAFLFWDYSQDVQNLEWVGKLSLFGTSYEYKVAIEIEKNLAEKVGFSTPHGFRVQPLEIDPKWQDDRKEINFVKKFNRENFTFITEERLSCSTPLDIKSKVMNLHSSGKVYITIEAAIGFGSHITGCAIPIGMNDDWISEAISYRDRTFENWKKYDPQWVGKSHAAGPAVETAHPLGVEH